MRPYLWAIPTSSIFPYCLCRPKLRLDANDTSIVLSISVLRERPVVADRGLDLAQKHRETVVIKSLSMIAAVIGVLFSCAANADIISGTWNFSASSFTGSFSFSGLDTTQTSINSTAVGFSVSTSFDTSGDGTRQISPMKIGRLWRERPRPGHPFCCLGCLAFHYCDLSC